MEIVDAEWIKKRLTGARGEKSRLADWLGMPANKVTKILTGERRVQAAEVPAILSFFEEEQANRSADDALPFRINENTGPASDSTMVQLFQVEASAGNGSVVDESDEVATELTLPRGYLRKITASHPRHLAIISVKGDSMSPTLRDDDLVMVDRSKTDLSFDGLFVLRFDNALHVKRIGRSPVRGHVRIISDNAVYGAQDYPADDVAAIGKVIWSGGKIG
ncbi:helix-turn-helix transcriptional regulator [Loktanella sp. 3ANDIMAR09]|uniref:S24 family peptidase n=1 Tax=Loktanella sp. 3ANDIMAR09 TaxID=1225657 RepID=UPI00155F4C79|nr:helix-turn-helix transcriptional regulator [Loktanella sp. 3ANDIMAR09]